jgi:phosphoserine phosphatase RsbU/P
VIPSTIRSVSAVVDPSIIPADEEDRLAAVRRYEILDTPRDGAFDRITRIASVVLDVPIAIVTIVDHDRIWFKAAEGLDGVHEIGRDPGLCASAILSDDVYLVNDAMADPRTLANPLVAGDFGLRFYAAAPLHTADGFNLGTMCVIDREPRELGASEIAVLEDLASLVVDELELRLAARRHNRRATELNDDVVQALAVAKLGFQSGQADAAMAALDDALVASKRILGELIEDAPNFRRS